MKKEIMMVFDGYKWSAVRMETVKRITKEEWGRLTVREAESEGPYLVTADDDSLGD